MCAIMCMYYHVNFTGGQTSHTTNLMYVQAEDIEVHGNFSINIPKKRVKEEVCKNLTKSHNYVSRIRGNTTPRPELKYIPDSDDYKENECFFSFCRNTVNIQFPFYFGLCASIMEPLEKKKTYFNVPLPTPNKTTMHDLIE